MGKYKSQWTGPQIDEGVGVALNPDTVPTAGSDALVTSDAVATVQAGLAPFENGATSSDDYAVGDLLVRAGILYKAKTAIAVGDAFTVDTNIEVATIAEVLENFNPGPDPYTSDPAMDGTASPGSSGDYARGDHVHPHDTSIQQISAPTLTSPASENIAAGKYRVYNNLLYKVTTAITSGETASSFASKLEAVPDGGLNDLKSAITKVESDLASIHASGSTNTTGALIPKYTYFYLNSVLSWAKADIATNATFTYGTNYETVTAGGLNALRKYDYDTLLDNATTVGSDITVPDMSRYGLLIFGLRGTTLPDSWLMPLVIPYSLFKTFNTQSKRIIVPNNANIYAEAWYVSDTKIHIYNISEGRSLSIYGIK